jgi:hypothetical protein
MQLAASTPQTTGRLLTVSPDLAKCLAVLTLSKFSLGHIASTLIDMCDFASLGKVMMNKGKYLVIASSVGDQRISFV